MMSIAPERVDLFFAKAKSEMAPKNDFAMMRGAPVLLQNQKDGLWRR